MAVEEFGQLLAQAFVALTLVAEKDGSFEQRLLQFLEQMTPKIRGSRAENDEIAVRFQIVRRAIRCFLIKNLTADVTGAGLSAAGRTVGVGRKFPRS